MSRKLKRTGEGATTRLVTSGREGSYLVDETFTMEQMRRAREQEGQRLIGVVHVREHSEENRAASQEGELQNDIKQHPLLDRQVFDGISNNETPVPAQNTEARREYDNAQHQQQLKMQQRLGLAPRTAPEFKP
ncbi:MAG: hypothetical protein WC785_10085 [Tatlockia sp.]|jgi:hypothetical protein